jgi:CBS domain-containing protein
VQVRDAMSTTVLTVGPGHTLRQIAQAMKDRKVGAAVVDDPDGEGAGIITERDILGSIAAGEDPESETAGTHQTEDVVYAAPDWTLEQAADEMLRHSFRHLVVLEAGDVVGIVSMRDLVRVYMASRDDD